MFLLATPTLYYNFLELHGIEDIDDFMSFDEIYFNKDYSILDPPSNRDLSTILIKKMLAVKLGMALGFRTIKGIHSLFITPSTLLPLPPGVVLILPSDLHNNHPLYHPLLPLVPLPPSLLQLHPVSGIAIRLTSLTTCNLKMRHNGVPSIVFYVPQLQATTPLTFLTPYMFLLFML
jgi:hypothetical protein